jgi:hypothetical protein
MYNIILLTATGAIMKNVVFASLMLSSLIASAEESPYDKFSGESNFTNKTTVTWKQVVDIQKECNIESKKRGYNGYNYSIEGCSFWDKDAFQGNVCYILTPLKTSFWTLGHELRHCFQGNFH